MEAPILYLMCGPVGAGKTTYVTELVKRTDAALISPDLLREEITGDMSNHSRDGMIFGSVIPCRMTGASVTKRPIAYDATCYNRRNRKDVIKHAKWLGYQIEAHVFRTPIEVCKARNAARTRVVPSEVIEKQFANWQEPELSECIDRIVEVNFSSTDL